MKKLKTIAALVLVAALALSMCACGAIDKVANILIPADLVIKVGDNYQVTPEFEAAENVSEEDLAKALEKLEVKWETSNSDVVTVDNGLITAVAEGEAEVKAVIGKLEAVMAVTAKPGVVDIEVADVTLNTLDETADIEYKILPENALYENLAFESSDEEVLTVSEDGKMTVVKAGEAKVKVTADDISSEFTVTVQQAPVELKADDISMYKGNTAEIKVSYGEIDETAVEPEVGTTLEYASDDEEVATVDENGVVTGVGTGTAHITVKNELGQEVTIEVTVSNKPVYRPAPASTGGSSGGGAPSGGGGGGSTGGGGSSGGGGGSSGGGGGGEWVPYVPVEDPGSVVEP